MVDVWLLFFFTFNATITAFHILIDEKNQDESKKNESDFDTEKVLFFGKKSLPVN